jgi:plasmid stabilization system protein ParE
VAPRAVVWTRLAREDLLSALRYLAVEREAPDAAGRLLDELEAAVSSLSDLPERGRIVPELGAPRRELLLRGYRVVYRVRTQVEVLRVLHGRQDFARAWRRGPKR